MTGQTAFDLELPADAGTVEQTAVVFTALGGARDGQETYLVFSDDRTRQEQADWLNRRASAAGRTPDARIMARTITTGPWRPT